MLKFAALAPSNHNLAFQIPLGIRQFRPCVHSRCARAHGYKSHISMKLPSRAEISLNNIREIAKSTEYQYAKIKELLDDAFSNAINLHDCTSPIESKLHIATALAIKTEVEFLVQRNLIGALLPDHLTAQDSHISNEVILLEKQTDPFSHSFVESLGSVVEAVTADLGSGETKQTKDAVKSLIATLDDEQNESVVTRLNFYAENIHQHAGMRHDLSLCTWSKGDRDGNNAITVEETNESINAFKSIFGQNENVLEFREASETIDMANGYLSDLASRYPDIKSVLSGFSKNKPDQIRVPKDTLSMIRKIISSDIVAEKTGAKEFKDIAERCELAAKNGIAKIGIANLKTADQVITMLNIARIFNVDKSLDIVFQPEDIFFALEFKNECERLYQNPMYREHLYDRGDKQFFSCGFSDLIKRGGYGASRLNGLVMQDQFDIAKKYGIEVTTNIITGNETARGGADFRLLRRLYSNTDADKRRITHSGLDVHRKWHLTPDISRLTCTIFDLEKSETSLEQAVPLSTWMRTCKHYNNVFYAQEDLSHFMEACGSFRFLELARDDSRPYYRGDTQEQLLCVDDVRAIPWTWSMIYAGVNFEGIGGASLASVSTEQLEQWRDTDELFQSYLGIISSCVARNDLDYTRSLISLELNADIRFSANTILDRIETEFETIKTVVIRAMTGKACEKITSEEINTEFNSLFETCWPEIARELRDKAPHVQTVRDIFLEYQQSDQPANKFKLNTMKRAFHMVAGTPMALTYNDLF